jgi:hypothetical protein
MNGQRCTLNKRDQYHHFMRKKSDRHRKLTHKIRETDLLINIPHRNGQGLAKIKLADGFMLLIKCITTANIIP